MKKILLMGLGVAMLCACAPENSPLYSNTNTLSQTNVNAMTTTCATDQLALPKKGEEIVTITTSMGVIKAKFFSCDTPKTVANFIGLAKKGYYDGIIFHRVIDEFMIQGGDPKGQGIGGDTFDGKPLMDEVAPGIKHLRGTLSMAKTAMPNSATSQFFIVQNHAGTPFLDGGYTAFGQVFEGLDVVDKIAKVKKDASDKPLTPVKMEKVEISTY